MGTETVVSRGEENGCNGCTGICLSQIKITEGIWNLWDKLEISGIGKLWNSKLVKECFYVFQI